MPGRPVVNKRLSLRQGDRPSGIWFCYAIDPLLVYLEKRLQGIPIYSLPVHGPVLQGQAVPLPPLETRYRVLGYLDDCKPAITTMAEFQLVDTACSLFERSSGCRLHRNPASQKCKVLLLGRWKGVLQQEDIPLPYLKITDHLDYLGCKLFADYSTTRRENGEILKAKVKEQIGSWKSGKFLSLTSRPWSINTYCLSKLWYRAACLDFRVGDCDAITSAVKGWLYQDMLLKPQEMLLFREVHDGGLGMYNVKARAAAVLIHTFLAQAVSPLFPTNHYLNFLYRWHVLGERELPDPGRPPYYPVSFFSFIKEIHQDTPLNIIWITLKQWYQLLLEHGITHTSIDQDLPAVMLKSRLEESNPEVEFLSSYRLMRIFGLAPEQKSFLFKFIQNILPTKERLHRVGKVQSSSCVFCNGQEDNIEHLFSCLQSKEVTEPLVECLTSQVEGLSFKDISLLKLTTSDAWELPAAWLLSACIMFIWEQRVAGRMARLDLCRAELISKINILKCTKWKHYTLHNSAVLLNEAINLHFL